MIAQLLNRFNLKSTLPQFAVFITVFAFLSIADAGDVAQQALGAYAIVVVMTIIGSHAIQKYAPLIGFQTVNLYISYVLLFLLIHPTQSYSWLVIACILVVLQKYFIRPAIRLFNPTALSLVLTYMISWITHSVGLSDTLLISWWGTDMVQSSLFTGSFLAFIIPAVLLFGCVYFVVTFHKVLLASTFFMTYMAWIVMTDLNTTFSSSASLAIITASFFNAIAFLSCIMVCEPKTSPAFTKHQALIGLLGGTILYALTRTSGSHFAFGDPFVTTLLFANLLTYPLKKYGILK